MAINRVGVLGGSNGLGTTTNTANQQSVLKNLISNNTIAKNVGSSIYPTTKNTGGSSGSSSSGSSNTYYNPYQDYLNALQEAQRRKIEAAKSAIDAQAQAGVQRYKDQLSQVGDDYQSLRNQSEVERYKAQKSLREALANRGALESGAGRQETLTLQNNYGNAINRINTEEQKERNTIQSYINELLANADMKKAQLEADAYGDVESILSGIMDKLTPSYNYSAATSQTYNDAKKSINSGANAYSNPITTPQATTNTNSNKTTSTDATDNTAAALSFGNYVSPSARKYALDRALQLGQISLTEYSDAMNKIL